MEIKHEIVKQLRDEAKTEYGIVVARKALKHFNGDYERAKVSLRNHRWSTPLSGVVYHEPCEDDVDYIDSENFREFDRDFMNLRYSKKIEVKLKADGTIDYDGSGWPPSIVDEREIEEYRKQRKKDAENWKPEITVADIIMASVRQFKEGIKFKDQWFVAEFSKKYIEDSKMNVWQYIDKTDEFFTTLRFPMAVYMNWNKIGFDGNKYIFNGKEVSLKQLLEKMK
jgi:hypothetical protein